MDTIIRYSIKNTPATAQSPNNATALGVTGVNFVGASVNLAMVLANPVAANNSDKVSILPTTANISSGTVVSKIVCIQIPAVLDATTVTYLSTPFSGIGINSEVVGVITLGLNRIEDANTAAYARNVLLEANLGYSVSKNRLIISIGTAINNIAGATLNILVLHKN